MPVVRPWRKSAWTGLFALAGFAAVVWLLPSAAPVAANGQEGSARQGAVTVGRRDFVRGVRLSGTVEAVQSTTIAAPRLAGPNTQSLVITRLVRPGSTVAAGRPRRRVRPPGAAHQRARPPRRARTISSSRSASARRRSARPRAQGRQRDQVRPRARSRRAELEMVKNEMLAEDPGGEEHSGARTGAGHAEAAEDDLRPEAQGRARPTSGSCSIRRDRAENAMQQAETNADAHGDHSRRSAAWRSSRRSGSRTTWRRCRKARRSAPACRSSTSSIPTRCACARGSTRRTSTSCGSGRR